MNVSLTERELMIELEDTFIDEDAKLAVKRGIEWLDENHPNWASRIDLTQLDMSECQDCVIGQAVGDYSYATRVAAGAMIGTIGDYQDAAIWAVEHGFESPHVASFQIAGGTGSYNYQDLDTLWSEEVRSRLG